MKAWGTPEGRLDPGGEVQQGHNVRIYTRVSDNETLTQSLNVEIRYRPPGGVWTTNTATYNESKNYFYYDLDTTSIELGMYDVKVRVSDLEGRHVSKTELGEFDII